MKIIHKIVKTLVVISVFALLVYGVWWDRSNQLKKIAKLKGQIDNLSGYKEKELRIQNMEKALLVCYGHLSKYEAHYYCIIYDDFAQKYGIPWEIYPAVIRIESNFDPTLCSPSKAKGIAQVVEATGKFEADKLGVTYKPMNTLWNDLLCQIFGFSYLSDAIKQKGLEDGVKCYLGGVGFDKGRKDIGEYRTTVRKEYDRLTYIYKGVQYDALKAEKTVYP